LSREEKGKRERERERENQVKRHENIFESIFFISNK
jgi:hypothetical protein